MADSSEFKTSVLNLIDLSSPDIGATVSLLKQACLDSGFFYVINHGIDRKFMDEVFSQSERFFSLPLEEKMKSLRNEKHRGYTPLFDQINSDLSDPGNQTNGDYKESYFIGPEISEDDEPGANRPLRGPNRWPSSGTWQKAVARLIALALDLTADFFDKLELMGTVRLLHYGDEISQPDKGMFGTGAHSDFGFITILAADVFGLQICKDKDAKTQVALIVNLGDMLERWSNSTFRSTLHRVLDTGRERYSIACFVVPHYDCIVEC
ncbi:hypothetical protein M569_14678 [Genlisea aurea]|uniref:Fe2OG dioxygenase domain-containing protein n=1 Tax=Genlisea aurea TaxID=192259 RepID=S8C6T2_9LAMI|nr:hypothetical protein M569_14678 [Genlisea aurea]